ncbi:MAG: carboxypeptidase regulatory-like domain-containing protein, partial [Myxococcales bacterium]|nr:carboxypeptidase regulatory-like domain-containing protein [Myxococcales bacterium]
MRRWWWVALLAIAALIEFLRWPRGGDDGGPVRGSAGTGSGQQVSGAPGSSSGPRATLMPSWTATRGLPGKRIAGIVTFEGARVAGATVRLTSWFPEAPEIVQTTGANGAFDFDVWSPPGYMISANAPGRVGVSQWVDLRDPTVKPSSDALELKLLGCAATLSGHVLDSSGGPIEKARVVLAGTRVETDRAGAYTVCASRGTATLRVSADGYGGVHLFIGLMGPLSRDVVLVPEITVLGRVIRAADGVAVPDAVVTISPAGAWGPDGPNAVSAVTDADGRFRASGIPPGQLTATALADGLVTEAQVKATAIVGQSPPDLTIRMIGVVRIRGKVLGAGKPIAGAKVVAIRKSPLAHSRDSITQADGSFELEHVLPGELVFKVTPYEVLSPANIVVKTDRDEVVIEVASLGVIAGRTLRDKKPVPRVEVRVIGGGEDIVVTSDDQGHYEAKGLAAGTFKLYPHAKEVGAFGGETQVVLKAAERKDNVDLDVPFGATIDGKVVDQEGKPVANVYVRYMLANGDLGESETGPDGSFHCHSMTGGGPYHPEVFPTRALQNAFPWAKPPVGIPLADGASRVEGVVLAVNIVRLGIRGRVVDDSGAAVADARVRAQPMGKQGAPTFASWLRLPSAVSDANGAFVIPDLPEDQYAVEARAPDGSEGIRSPAKPGGSPVEIVVQRAAGIDGTLVGFTETPVVYAQSRKDTSRFASAQLDGGTFTFRGLSAGPYTVTAQSTNEG